MAQCCPILHLNGYKIANPTVLSRLNDETLTHLFLGYGYKPYFVEGHEPEAMHQLMAKTMQTAVEEIQAIQKAARSRQVHGTSRVADDRHANTQRAGPVQRPSTANRSKIPGGPIRFRSPILPNIPIT